MRISRQKGLAERFPHRKSAGCQAGKERRDSGEAATPEMMSRMQLGGESSAGEASGDAFKSAKDTTRSRYDVNHVRKWDVQD